MTRPMPDRPSDPMTLDDAGSDNHWFDRRHAPPKGGEATMLATRNTTGSKHDAIDAVPADELAPSEPPEGPPDRRPRGGFGWRTAAALLVVVLVALVVALSVAWRDAAGRADRLGHTDDLRSSALAAATAYAVDLTTYDHDHLADQQAKLAEESTSRFQSTFADSMKTLGPIFERVHASATGKVTSAAVAKVDGRQATVIAFVDQVAKSTQMPKPQTQASRVSMVLVRQDGRWLLDRVDLV